MKEPNLPPANIEAEEAILGCILFDPQAIARVESSLTASAFYVSAHQEIYQTMLKLYHQGNPTDFMAVSTYLTVIEVGHKIVDLGYDSTLELEKLLNDSEQEIFSVTQQRIRSETEHNSKIAISAFKALESNDPIYPTGIQELDRLIIGLEPGTLTILAARPSMGKSALKD